MSIERLGMTRTFASSKRYQQRLYREPETASSVDDPIYVRFPPIPLEDLRPQRLRPPDRVSAYDPKGTFSPSLSHLRITSVMQLGNADQVWMNGELVEIALYGVVTDEPRGRKVGRFSVIDGGRKD